MERLKKMFFIFTQVTTITLIVTSLYIGAFYSFDHISGNVLWQIICCSAVATLGNLIYPQKELSKRQMMIYTVIHYMYINVIVLGCGIYFDWFNMNALGQVIAMLLIIALVFMSVTYIVEHRYRKLADEMNERIKAYNEKS